MTILPVSKTSKFYLLYLICITAFAWTTNAHAKSTTPPTSSFEQLVSQLTLEEKVSLLAGESAWTTTPIKRLGIPSLLFSDGPTGVRSVDGDPATVFPVGVAVAATWNPLLIERMAHSLGQEARSRGIQVLLAPMANVHRSPLGGRNFESYSEDPYLGGKIGAAYVRGLQSAGVGATVKHFVANNQEHNRLFIDAIVSDRALREIYLATFEHIIKEAKPWAVMSAYNQVNGSFMSSHQTLLRKVLKGEWAYDGLVMSDWGATHSALAAEAGLDLEMPGPAKHFGQQLLDAVKAGKVSQSAIDDAAIRVLRLIDRATQPQPPATADVDQSSLAKAVASEAITLLKNEDDLLPLDIKKTKRIAIVGPNADAIIIQGGGSSHVVPALKQTPLEAIRGLLQDEPVEIIYAQGTDNELIPPGADYRLFSPTRDRNQLGLKVDFYSNSDLSGSPVKSGVDRHFEKVGFGTSLFQQTDGQFAARWSGYFFPPKDGDYQIHLIQSGSVELKIDSKTLVSPDMPSHKLKLADIIPATAQATSISLKKGQAYPVSLTYHAAKYPFQFLRFGVRTPSGTPEEAIAAAKTADVVLVFAGVSTTSEQEGQDRSSMAIHGGQNELIESVAAANSNTVVILNNGGPVAMPWIDKVPAVVSAWLPGQHGAAAVADMLFGRSNPSGKLPMTFPYLLEDNPSHATFPGDKVTRYDEGIFVGYRHYDTKSVAPLFPFGHGLSYSTFKYSKLTGPQTTSAADPMVHITLEVKNTSQRAGSETVQVYISDLKSTLPRPTQELKSFAKLALQPGETKRIGFELDKRSFAFWDDAEQQWRVEPGLFAIRIGSSSRDIRLAHELELK